MKLFIIDLMPFLYKGHFVFLRNPRMTASGINTSALLGLANGLLSILKREQPTHAVFAMDPSGPTFRHQAYAPYKQTRQKMPEDLAASIPYAFELAEALKIPVLRVEGFEADDVMGTLAVKGAAAGFDVYMATPDKDAAQLVRPGVRLYRPAHAGDAAEIYDEQKVCEHWHLESPRQMIDYLALAGDTADNIPGIRGVGEKTAADLLANYHDVEGILENQAKLKGKLAEKVFAGREDAKISKFLTTIRTDVPIEPDWDAYRLDGIDREKLAAVCAKFELNRFAKEFGVESGGRFYFDAERTPRLPTDGTSRLPTDGTSRLPTDGTPRLPTDGTSRLPTDGTSRLPAADRGRGVLTASELNDISTTPHDYRYVSTEAEAQELLAELMKAPRIAFDTETTAREPGMSATDAKTCRLIGFSFATEPGKAWYVDAGLIDIFRPLFADPTKTLIGFNVKFDRAVLHRYGIGFASTPHDVMLAHYCLDAASRHGMDLLAESYLNYRTIRFSEVAGEPERGKSEPTLFGKDIAKVTDYAAEDADITLQLEDVLRAKALAVDAESSPRQMRAKALAVDAESSPRQNGLSSSDAVGTPRLRALADVAKALVVDAESSSRQNGLSSSGAVGTPRLRALADVAKALADVSKALVVDAESSPRQNGLSSSDAVGTPRLRALADVEEPLVKVLLGMEREGVRIDVEALKEYGRELDREILSLTQEVLKYAEPGFNPDSPKQLGVLLFDRLGLKGSKKTASGQWATDEKTLSKLVGEHPVIPAILEYRACTKLKSTYVDKLPTLIDENGRVHTTYAQAFTETGRLSSSDPNLQNIPIRTERGKLIRKAFVARDADHVIVSADYSQIELRLMAAFAQDEAMLAAFRRGEDIHRDTASRVYDIMPAFVSPEQRSKCKMVNFGIIYGISAFGLSQRLKVPRKEAADLIETYFKLYPRVKDYMAKAIAEAREKGYAETVLGRRRTLRDISSRNATARQAAERDAINTPIQGSAADLIKVAMVNVDAALRHSGLRAKMVLQIHDELVFDCPRGETAALTELVKREMSGALDFGVPLEVSVGVGDNWLEAH